MDAERVSEKSTRNDLDYAVESTAARNRSYFDLECSGLLQNPQEQCNPSESVPKEEIPAYAFQARWLQPLRRNTAAVP